VSRSQPAIASGNAKDLLKEAAEAVGMDPKALAKLAIDAYGAKLVPKGDDTITRKELGLTLWRELQAIDKANRGDWYQKLADEQQVSLIVALRHEGYRSDVIARDLKISQYTVTELYNRYADTVGAQVSFIRINTILGIMTSDLELAQEGLRKDGDWGAFWRARKEYIKLLQDLGIVERAVQRIEVTHNFEQAKQAEIDSILELERKKKVRLEEIKRAEFTVTSDDRVPQIGSGS
jgi:hypothetical protein